MQNIASPDCIRHVFPNGLRVLVAPLPHTRSATLALFFGTGSRYETAGEQGIAHLVEHMLFKGTASYPTAQLISETIEGVGGVLNASTEKEVTVYWAKVASRHVPLAFDLLADMVQRPLLDPAELTKEKKVVLEELGLAQDAPGDWVHQLFSELLWPDQPLGREIAGTTETVNAQTAETVAAYVQRGYRPSNMVLVVAGNADAAWIAQEAAQRFSGNGSPAPAWEPAREATGQPLVTVQARETEQAYLCLGGRGYSRGHPDRYALRLANAILGDGMSSRLFLEVREHRGLAYDVHSYVSAFHDSGAVFVSAGVDPDQTDDAIQAILKEVDKMRQHAVPAAELRKIKEYVKGRTLLGLEDSASVAQWYASQELLTQELLSPDEVMARYEAVTEQDILRVSQHIFTPDWLNLSYIGPDADADHLRSRLRFG